MPRRTDATWHVQPSAYPEDDDCLEWLWRRLRATDGRTAVCPRCDRPTRFYRLRICRTGNRAAGREDDGRPGFAIVGTC